MKLKHHFECATSLMLTLMVILYRRLPIPRTLEFSEKGPIPLYLGLGQVRATICLMSARDILCSRYSTPRIRAGKFCPMDSEVHDKSSPTQSTFASEWTKRKKLYVALPRVTTTHIYLLYIGSIRGIGASDPPIPRIEVACHNSSEVSTIDLYTILCYSCARPCA